MLALHRHLLPHRLRHSCNRLIRRYKSPAPPTPDWLSLANSAAEYAVSLTQAYLQHGIPGAPRSLAGKHVLELGPGRDFTPALVMTGYGAQVTVADLYLEKWNAEYHPFFYRQVRQRIVETHPDWPVSAIDQVIERNDHWGGSLRTRRCGLERLTRISNQSFDVTISNAVLEHLYDVPRALRELYRVTRVGGVGSHQVDFRDHRDFSRPLEFLCEADFVRTVDREGTGCGTTLRPCEMQALLREIGFMVDAFSPDSFAEPAYLADVRPRLLEGFRHFSDEQLRPVGGLFLISRPK